MQPGRTTNTGGGTMEVVAADPRCQLLLILLMSAVMLLPGTNGSLLLVQRTVTRTIVLQETIGKGDNTPYAFPEARSCDTGKASVKGRISSETKLSGSGSMFLTHTALCLDYTRHSLHVIGH
ncbi:hypothetical protein STEG23_030310 [Scotinomys teguina]